MQELKTLSLLEKTAGKNDKIKILKSNSTDQKLHDLLDAALNFKRKYFLKKFEMPPASHSKTIDHHQTFLNLLALLETRQITGHAAIAEVEKFFSRCTAAQQTWYSRVLLKDLKCGFTTSTANKAGYKLEEFKCMLAKADKDCKTLDKMIETGGWLSVKFDGYRCIAEIEDGHCTLLSRNGTEYKNFPMINEALESLFPTGKHMLDGEIMSDSFQSMQSSAFANKRGTVVGDMIFHVFDTVPWAEWCSKKFKTKASKRYKDMEAFHTANPHPLIEIVEHEWTDDIEYIIQKRDEYIAMGFEGVMFLPDIPYYVGKKSNKMLKFKKMETMEVTITGIYEGEKGKELEGSLGGFEVTQEDGEQCRVGTLRGITREERQRIFDDPAPFIGRVFEAEYQEIGSQGKMRFPVFVRWRDDKE